MAKLPNRDKVSDPRLVDARPTDIVIPVIGDTGAGKSYLINKVLRYVGQMEEATEGNTLASCTTCIQSITIDGHTGNYGHLRGRRIILVDCPGFDSDPDTNGDYQILKRLANWLKQSYPKGTVVGGLIYLHDISVTRSRPDGFQKKLEQLNQLYDDKVPFSAVVFVTSKWGYEDEEVCVKRESQYQEVHWKNVLKPVRQGEKGARVMRLKGGSQDDPKVSQVETNAWAIIDSILKEMEERAVDGLLSEVRRIERNSINVRDTQAAADLRAALEKYRKAEEDVLALQESVEGESDSGSDRKRRLGEAEKDVQHLSQRIQRLAYSLLDQLSRLSRWIFNA